MKDFRASLRINLRDKVGSSKAVTLKVTEAQVNGDRVLEISLSLPRNMEECAVAGNAKQAIVQSGRVPNAPKWLYRFVNLVGDKKFTVPGIYISVICPKIKDASAFQEHVFKHFPELAGGQLGEWQMGDKLVQVLDSSAQDGTQVKQPRRAFFTRICLPLAVHYAGSGTVALDRRAPDTQWLSFESSAYRQYLPCKLCQGHDGHYATQTLERPKGMTEEILICPNKGTCPDCGKSQAAFLYGGHLAECIPDKPRCEECKDEGAQADHKPMDLLRCKSYLRKSEEEARIGRAHQAAVNTACESLLARAISSKGVDFAPYLKARRLASKSKSCLNDFYKAHEELGNFEEQLRAMAPGMVVKNVRVRGKPDRKKSLAKYRTSVQDRMGGSYRGRRVRGCLWALARSQHISNNSIDSFFRLPDAMRRWRLPASLGD